MIGRERQRLISKENCREDIGIVPNSLKVKKITCKLPVMDIYFFIFIYPLDYNVSS